MYNQLTTEKRNSLVLQLKTERDKRVAYRISAVLLLMKVWALFLDEETSTPFVGL
jgi:hypothetical protein